MNQRSTFEILENENAAIVKVNDLINSGVPKAAILVLAEKNSANSILERQPEIHLSLSIMCLTP